MKSISYKYGNIMSIYSTKTGFRILCWNVLPQREYKIVITPVKKFA